MNDEKQIVLIGSRVRLRNITLDDIHQLYSFIYGEAAPEWKKWDAPYYPLESKSYEQYREEMARFIDMDLKPTPEMLMEVNGEIIGLEKCSSLSSIQATVFVPNTSEELIR